MRRSVGTSVALGTNRANSAQTFLQTPWVPPPSIHRWWRSNYDAVMRHIHADGQRVHSAYCAGSGDIDAQSETERNPAWARTFANQRPDLRQRRCEKMQKGMLLTRLSPCEISRQPRGRHLKVHRQLSKATALYPGLSRAPDRSPRSRRVLHVRSASLSGGRRCTFPVHAPTRSTTSSVVTTRRAPRQALLPA